MNKPTFGNGVALALALALAAAAAFWSLTMIFSASFVLRAIIVVLSALYVGYLIAGSGQKTGRLAALLLWTAAAAASWFLAPTVTTFLLAQAAVLWLVRALYYHASTMSAALDLGLCALSAMAAIATARHADSVLLSVWVFFLVQALFVAIPALSKTRRHDLCDDAFKRARRSAEAAIRRMYAAS